MSSEPSEPKKSFPFEPKDAIVYATPILAFLLRFLPLQRLAGNSATLKTLLADPDKVSSFLVVPATIGFILYFWLKRPKHPKDAYQPGKINIWIAELERDNARHDTRARLIGSLKDLFGDSIAILRADICPLGGVDKDVTAGNLLAQEYLTSNQGEIIIWGEFIPEAPLIDLRLVSVAHDGSRSVPFAFDHETYRPVNKALQPYFTAALAALVAKLCASKADEDSGYVPQVVQPLVAKLETFVKALPREMSQDGRARIYQGLGNLYYIHGRFSNSMPHLRLSMTTLLRARRCWMRVPNSDLRIAETLCDLSRASLHVGSRSTGDLWLNYAVSAADWALGTIEPTSDFKRWGHCIYSKSFSLLMIGFRSDNISILEKAGIEANLILEHELLGDYPMVYALALGILSGVYANLGRLENNIERIDLAIWARREQVAIYKREKRRFDWATAKLNEGNDHFNAWIIDEKKERLVEALRALKRSARIFSPTCFPSAYAESLQMIGHVMAAQHQWKEAQTYYWKALHSISRDNNEYLYLDLQRDLRNALAGVQAEGGYFVSLGGKKDL